MFKSVSSRDPLKLIHPETGLQEAKCTLGYFPNILTLQRLHPPNLGKLQPHIPLIPIKHLQLPFRKLPQTLLNQIKLIHFVLPRKHRHPIYQLPHNTPSSPHVHGFGVVIADEKLRAAVPASSYIVGEGLAGGGGGTGEAEIAELEVQVGVEKEVLGLDIAVDYLGGVEGF